MTTIHSPLRIGFLGGSVKSAVGYTHHVSSHLDGFYRLDSGCFSCDSARNVETGASYGVSADRIHSDWEQMIATEKSALDAVVILTPTPAHSEMVIAALDAGLPVICEKALAVSSAECKAIGEAVARNAGFLAVTYNYSGYPMVRELRRMIADGCLGEIQQIHIEMPQEGFLRRAAAPQSWRLKDFAVPVVSLDLGVHVHHLIHFLTGGKRPLEVVGDQSTYGQFGSVVDNVSCMARYEDNLRVQSWFGKTALGYRNGLRIRVFGSEASAEWLQMNPEDLHISGNDGRRMILDRGSEEALLSRQTRYNRFKPGHPAGFVEAFANLYADIAEKLRAHQSGSPSPNDFVYGARESEEGLLFLEAIALSTQSRTWQPV